jgi:hypothetical protein
VVVMLTIALAIVTGGPDIGRSLDLVTGTAVTGAAEFAFIGLLCWSALAVLISLIAADALRQLKHPTVLARWRLPVAALMVGVSLLAAGIVRHQSGYHVCCSSALTAQQAEQRDH